MRPAIKPETPLQNIPVVNVKPLLFTVSQWIVVLWRHANAYCDVILTYCHLKVSRGTRASSRRRQIYHSLTIELD